jgi:hypothetical protein
MRCSRVVEKELSIHRDGKHYMAFDLSVTIATERRFFDVSAA